MSTMKSPKVTSQPPGRWYHDACGAAHGLELLGERWALLVVRELMFGSRRFGQIRAALTGVSAKVLTERLEGLQAAGIVVRATLAPPASTPVYDLTPWGREAEPIFVTLGRWAARSPGHDPTLPFSAASMMLSFRTMFDPSRAAGLTVRIGFRLPDDGMVAGIADGRLEARRAEPEGCDAVFVGPPPLIAAVVYGGLPLEQARAAGLETQGDAALLVRFSGLFPLPDKAA